MAVRKYDGFAPAASGNTFVPGFGKKQNSAPTYEDDKFIYVEGIAIFDEHDGRDEDIEGVYFDAELLQVMCDNANKLIADTNSLVPLYAGHLDESLPEEDQGVLFGFADRFYVGTVGDVEPRACIYCRYLYLKDKYEFAKDFPRRSIELHYPIDSDGNFNTARKHDIRIDNIALIKRQPARDLPVQFTKNNEGVAKYKYQMGDVEMDHEELIKKCLEAVMATPEFAYMSECLNKQNEQAKMDATKTEINPIDPKLESKAKLSEDDGDEATEDEEGAPGVNYAEDDGKEDGKEDFNKAKLQRDQSRRQVAKLQAAHKDLTGRLNEMERKARVADRKSDLLGLEGEGIQFDIADELDAVADMDVATYSKYLGRMRKNYKRDITKVERIKLPAIVSNDEMQPADAWSVANAIKSGKAKSVSEAFQYVKESK